MQIYGNRVKRIDGKEYKIGCTKFTVKDLQKVIKIVESVKKFRKFLNFNGQSVLDSRALVIYPDRIVEYCFGCKGSCELGNITYMKAPSREKLLERLNKILKLVS